MSQSDFLKLAENYDYFLFDCDGVLWIGKKTIEGSFEALTHLLKLDKKIILLTNASARSRHDVVEKARDIHGFPHIDFC